MNKFILCFLVFFSSMAFGKEVNLNLKMKYSHKRNFEKVNTLLQTQIDSPFFIDHKKFRAELQAKQHPQKADSIIIIGRVYKRNYQGRDQLISRPKMTIPFGKSKKFSIRDENRRFFSIDVTPKLISKKEDTHPKHLPLKSPNFIDL